jgi:hypothetical protein
MCDAYILQLLRFVTSTVCCVQLRLATVTLSDFYVT